MRENSFTGYGQIIKAYRSRAGLSQAGLGDILSVSRNTVINWEAERSQPDMYYIRALCEALKIPLGEIFHMASESDYTLEERQTIALYRELTPTGRRIIWQNMVTLRDVAADERDAQLKKSCIFLTAQQSAAAAGTGIPFNDLPPEIQFVFRTPANEKADTIIRVSGRSMEPYYHDGDRVYVRYTDGCSAGDIVVCSTADGAVIKRVNEQRQLVSLNPDYPFGMKGEDDHVRMIGIVLGIVQPDDIPSADEIAVLQELFAAELRTFKKKYGIAD